MCILENVLNLILHGVMRNAEISPLKDQNCIKNKHRVHREMTSR